MYTSPILRQAEDLVERQRYLDALTLIEQRIDALPDPAIPAEPPLPDSVNEDLDTYLRRHGGEQFSTALRNAQEVIALCAAGTQLCMLTLGMGARAATLMQRASDEADRFPEPFNEMLMSSEEYFSMMWYYFAIPNKDVALRNAYRVNSRYPSLAYEARCQAILEAQDWNYERCRYVSFYLLFPDENIYLALDNTLLQNPASSESYDAAIREGVLATLERGRHTEDNDWYWMQTLHSLVDDVHELIGLLPVDALSEQERAGLYDAMLTPLAGHIAYQQSDGFKTGYANPAKSALKTFKDPIFANLPSIQRIRDALSGSKGAAGAVREAAQPVVSDDGYFVSTVFQNNRVFLSSSFRDMLAERDHLLTFTFPDADRHLREFGVRLTPVDLRGIKLDGSEEGYDKECFKYCLNEIDRCDSIIGLIGSRYGWVMYDENSTDPAMAAIVQRVAREHGVPLRDMAGKSITHIEMMYGLRALERKRCYFYIRNLAYTNGASEGDLYRIGYADGHYRESTERQTMIMDAFGIQRIAPEDEPGANVQYYSASFDGRRISDVEVLGENIKTKLIHDHVFQRSAKRREPWHTRLLSYWSDMAHLSIPHPRLGELLESKDRFIYLTGEEGIGKTTLLAQFWETMRERAVVVPVEALLESECNSVESMVDYAATIEARLRADMPKGLKKTKDIFIILDGLERVIGRYNRTTLLDNFREQYHEDVHVIVCSHEQNLVVPDYFKVMRLTEPPAPAADLVRNTAYKTGKRLDIDTIARVAEIAGAANGNPLYIDLVTRRLLYLLQDEFEENYIQWLDKTEKELDGTVRSAGVLTARRAILAVDMPDRALAISVIEQLQESKQGSLPLTGLVAILQNKGLLVASTEKRASKESSGQEDEQLNRLLRVISLLSPILLYDYSRKTITLAHQSGIGTGKLAEEQAEIIGDGQGAGGNDVADPSVLLAISYVLGAVVAGALAVSLVFIPYDPSHVVRTVVQAFVMALLYTPLVRKHEEGANKATPSVADLLITPPYWLAMLLSALVPFSAMMGENLPQSVAPIAKTLVEAFPYLECAILSFFGMIVGFSSVRPKGGKALFAGLVALISFAMAGFSAFMVIAGGALPLSPMPGCLGVVALLFLLLMLVER